MAAAIADPADPGGTVPVKRGRKKLILIVVAALVSVLLLGAGTVVVLKKRAAAQAAAAAAEGETDDHAAASATAPRFDPKVAPIYLPLDPFVVNLADRETDRYAQIAMTFEVETGSVAEQMKTYMPAIRNAVLMILANKTSRDLHDRAGKEQLAQEIMREAVRPLGIAIPAPEPVTAASAEVAAAPGPAVAASGAASARPKSARRNDVRNPLHHVHFSSFIIQ